MLKNRFNWKLGLGISAITAIVFIVLYYVAFVSSNSPKITTTTYTEYKEATKSTEKTTETTNTKEISKKVVENTTPPKGQKLIITQKDFGQLITLNKSQEVFLRLSNEYIWLEPKPKTTGEITLVKINYDVDPGFREWQITYTTPSTATIESNITTGTLGTDAEITKFFVTLKSK